jgi:hypothetical protein
MLIMFDSIWTRARRAQCLTAPVNLIVPRRRPSNVEPPLTAPHTLLSLLDISLAISKLQILL